MCQEVTKAVEELGPQKIMALCTDNASNMKKAWRLLQQKYSNLECYGCLAYGLNRIFADGLKQDSVNSIISECTNLIKTIKQSYFFLAAALFLLIACLLQRLVNYGESCRFVFLK